MRFPTEIEKFIEDNIGWRHNPRRVEARCSLNMEADEYLGTYFPRSFCESYEIFKLLFNNHIIDSTFGNKSELNILDIGSGTGGNLMGFIWLLKEMGFLNPNRNFTLYLWSIDGDRKGLEIQKTLVDHFFGENIAADYIIRPFESGQSAIDILQNHLDRQNQKYDIIMCSKFVNEFYKCESECKSNSGLYGKIAMLAGKFLCDDGLFVISDITTRSFDPLGAWLPELMSSEITKAVRNIGTGLSYIQPLSCAFFYHKCLNPQMCYPQYTFRIEYECNRVYRQEDSRLCFKVLARKRYAKSVLQAQKAQKGYIIAEKQYGGINTCLDSGNFAVCTTNDSNPQSLCLNRAYGW